MEVNLYDFDHTIYDGDSTVDFYLFCLKKKPSVIKYIPLFLVFSFLYLMKITTKEKMKEKLFVFLNDFDNIDELVNEFWTKKSKKIKKFYLKKEHQNDIIISASPEFLLSPIAKKLKVKKLIASKVNKKTGKFISKNCCSEEKVKRLKKYNSNLTINEAYSDSHRDAPILKQAKSSFLVKKNKIINQTKIKKNKNNKILIIKGILFIISNSILPLLFVNNSEYTLFILLLLLFFNIIISIIIYIFIIQDQIKVINKRIEIISIFIGLYIVSTVSRFTYLGPTYIDLIFVNYIGTTSFFNTIKLIIYILSIPSIIAYIYILIEKLFPFIKNEYQSLNNIEKSFITINIIIGAILTIIIYKYTNAFYFPTYKHSIFAFDGVIYSSDSGLLNKTNAYLQISAGENDIRQPLFGLFSLPFATIAKFISNFFEFIPNSYYIIFNIIQILLLILSIIMLSRMICKSKEEQALFFGISISTYSIILFSFVFEQYIISLFYLILTFYIWNKYKPKTNYFYIAAFGTLSTSGIIIPIITSEKIKNLKKYFINNLKTFLALLVIMITTGQIITISKKRIDYLMFFTGKKLKFSNRLKQFLYFVRTTIIAPSNNKVIIYNKYACYRLDHINFYSIIGIIILLTCFISFIINRKKVMAKISFLWIIFSFIILGLIGWGTKENGLILYSLYFFWAYISLIVMLINNIKNKKIRLQIYMLIIMILAFYNSQEFVKLLKFCLTYYRN